MTRNVKSFLAENARKTELKQLPLDCSTNTKPLVKVILPLRRQL